MDNGDDFFEKDDPYGKIRQKDIDKMMKDMSYLKVNNIDLKKLRKIVITPKNGIKPDIGIVSHSVTFLTFYFSLGIF